MKFDLKELVRLPAFLSPVMAKFNQVVRAVRWLLAVQDSEFIFIRRDSTGWAVELKMDKVATAVGVPGAVEEASSGGTSLPAEIQPRLIRFCNTVDGQKYYMWVLGWEPTLASLGEPDAQVWPPSV